MVVETNAGAVSITRSDSHFMYCDPDTYRGEREKSEHRRAEANMPL